MGERTLGVFSSLHGLVGSTRIWKRQHSKEMEADFLARHDELIRSHVRRSRRRRVLDRG